MYKINGQRRLIQNNDPIIFWSLFETHVLQPVDYTHVKLHSLNATLGPIQMVKKEHWDQSHQRHVPNAPYLCNCPFINVIFVLWTLDLFINTMFTLNGLKHSCVAIIGQFLIHVLFINLFCYTKLLPGWWNYNHTYSISSGSCRSNNSIEQCKV